MEKDIYSLKLHESISINDNLGTVFVQRVPNGWNYIYKWGVHFVPFHKEFKEKHKQTEIPIKVTIEERKSQFVSSLKPLAKKYEGVVIDEFIEYWTEPNQSKTKMKFEIEKTWDNSRRLSTWSKRSNQFKKSEQNEQGNKIDWK